MKLFKTSILALAAVTAVGFTSCSDDDNFEPGKEGTGVYFANDLPAKVTVETTTTSFPVTLTRTGITGAATYNVTAETDAEAGLFTFPATVAFAEGETTATYTVTTDLSAQLPDSKWTVTLTLADAPEFNYGNNSYTFTVEIPALWGPAEKFESGLCTWFYDLNFAGLSGPDPDLPIYLRKDQINPNKQQFIIDGWRYNTPLYINYDETTDYCTIPWDSKTGQTINVTDLGARELFITDYYTYKMFKAETEEERAEIEEKAAGASFYDPEMGHFDLYVVYYIWDAGEPWALNGSYGYETCQVAGYGDYSLEFSFEGALYDGMGKLDCALLNANIGSDATDARFFASTTLSAQAIYDGLADGTITDFTSAKAGNDQMIKLPVNGSGKYTCVGLTFKGDEPVNAQAISFNIISNNPGPDDKWTTYSFGELVDGWVCARYKWGENGEYTYEDVFWEVEIQQSTEDPSIFRMVNPYSSEDATPVRAGINIDPMPANVAFQIDDDGFTLMPAQFSGCVVNWKIFDTSTAKDELWIGDGINLVGGKSFPDEQSLIDAGLASFFDGEGVEVPACLFGLEEEFGYNWQSNPVGYIWMGDGSNNVAKRIAGRKKGIAKVMANKVMAPAKAVMTAANAVKIKACREMNTKNIIVRKHNK